MKSRRSFIAKTTMATTALLATKPFEALAGISKSFNGFAPSNNHLVFLHTGDPETAFVGKTGRYISSIRNEVSNNIFLHTGKGSSNGKFDAETIGDDYQVIQKAGIKTGIIHITANETNPVEKINRQANHLKKAENCQMVICISHLRHKSQSATDNLTLAAASENVDMIIGNDINNPAPKTLVIANKHKGEVLLQYSKHKDLACAKTEFAFSSNGEKRHIHVASKLYKHSLA